MLVTGLNRKGSKEKSYSCLPFVYQQGAGRYQIMQEGQLQRKMIVSDQTRSHHMQRQLIVCMVTNQDGAKGGFAGRTMQS